MKFCYIYLKYLGQMISITLFSGLQLQPPNINPLEVVPVPKKDYCLHSQEVQMHQTRLKMKMN